MEVQTGTHYERIDVFANEAPEIKKAIKAWFEKMENNDNVDSIGGVDNVAGSREEVL